MEEIDTKTSDMREKKKKKLNKLKKQNINFLYTIKMGEKILKFNNIEAMKK